MIQWGANPRLACCMHVPFPTCAVFDRFVSWNLSDSMVLDPSYFSAPGSVRFPRPWIRPIFHPLDPSNFTPRIRPISPPLDQYLLFSHLVFRRLFTTRITSREPRRCEFARVACFLWYLHQIALQALQIRHGFLCLLWLQL